MPQAQYGLDTPLQKVIGDKSAPKLARARGLKTVRDFLEFFPRRYIDARSSGRLDDFNIGDYAVLTAKIAHVKRKMDSGKRGMCIATIEDEAGVKATATFFSAYPHYKELRTNELALFSGEVGDFRGTRQLTHPQYTMLDDPNMSVYAGGFVPVYSQVKGVTNLQLSMAYSLAFDLVGELDDPLPKDIRGREGLVSLTEAYRFIHMPKDTEQVKAARKRFSFDEAFITQLVLAQQRYEARQTPTKPRLPRQGGLLDRFDANLPFELTAGQVEVGETIARDLAQQTPMRRLLQGEVGSGKTLVALRAMLTVVDAGAQAALLAPTEVLAAQHASSITAMLGELAGAGSLFGGSLSATKVTLLTGSMSTAARKQAMLDIASGQAGIVIGTHALLQEKVSFADLALVVVDEQHRFGVEQRALLGAKAEQPPHELVMTATPIPRTVAMTAFGDLDVSTLRSLPKGRAPIVSHVVPASRQSWMDRVWQRIAEECAAGRQAYVVAGRIGAKDAEEDVIFDSNSPDGAGGSLRPTGVVELVEQLRANPALAGLNIGLMHGQLPADEKDAVMKSFGAGDIDVLVATTVIEVGVDVPNASMIVIMDAERFGLSQLHQLRGRVGRGSSGGLALLVTRSEDPLAHERLTRVAETTNGFDLADLDLELRREGDVLGARQSGRRSSLTWLRLTRASDLAVIERARHEAVELIEHDPHMASHPSLAAAVADRIDEEQAEFLERG